MIMASGSLLTAVATVAVWAQTPVSPQTGWQPSFRDFVIAAWSPPAATAAEYQVYREAGFNLVMSPRYELPDRALELAQKHGLQVMVDTYTPNDKPWGGTAGPYTPHPSHHPATRPELEWLHARYGQHPVLAGYLLGDDYGALPPELVETTQYLHQNAPHLFPWVCQNVMSAESLAKAGNPIQDPQIYPTLYQKDWPAEEQCRELCRQLRKLRDGCRRYDLIPWPMFNVCGVESDSLVRFQVYAALAYGAQGIWYFTYRDGLRRGAGGESVEEVRRELFPTWAVAAEANRRVAAWGPQLLGRTCAGVFHTGWRAAAAGGAPGDGKLIQSMSGNLLAGVLTRAGAAPLVMVVDKRTSKVRGELGECEAELCFAPQVRQVKRMDRAEPVAVSGSVVRLRLAAGSGCLLALEGEDLARFGTDIERRPSVVSTAAGKDGLVLALTFDEGSGDRAKDSSGLGNDVGLIACTWVEGRSGRAIRLNPPGACGRVLDATIPAEDAMTLSAWVRPSYPTEGYYPVLYVGSGPVDRFEFGFGPDNLYPVITDHESHSAGKLYVGGMRALIAPDTWGHIAVCAGPQGATTYVNGKAVATTDYVGRFDFEARDIFVGVRSGEYYRGDTDEVRIWNRCLTAAEVAALAAR